MVCEKCGKETKEFYDSDWCPLCGCLYIEGEIIEPEKAEEYAIATSMYEATLKFIQEQDLMEIYLIHMADKFEEEDEVKVVN